MTFITPRIDLAPRSPWSSAIHRARALDGDLDALIAQSKRVIARPPGEDGHLHQLQQTEMLDPALWPAFDLAARVFADKRDLVRPADWRRSFYQSTARWLDFQATLEELALRLTVRGVRWLPIKGYDVGTRFYPERELRTMSDIDVLIAQEDFAAARNTLEAGGWSPVYSGVHSEDYLIKEGYCWPMISPTGVLVELHIRLWGLVPTGFEQQVFETSVRLEEKSNEMRPSAANAWILAAVHSWFATRPRSVQGFRDLEWIVRSLGDGACHTRGSRPTQDELLDQIEGTVCEWDLQLLAALSAITCHRLFANPFHAQLAALLEPHLERSETRLVARLRNKGIDELTFSRIARVRLLAGRRSRSGFRSLFRRLWAHPAVVERETDARRPFWWRRLAHLTRGFRRPLPVPSEAADPTSRHDREQIQVLGGESTH